MRSQKRTNLCHVTCAQQFVCIQIEFYVFYTGVGMFVERESEGCARRTGPTCIMRPSNRLHSDPVQQVLIKFLNPKHKRHAHSL
jgi:hypothetical protein